MFYLEDGREHLFQWDIDRRLRVDDPTITQVHFCNKTDDCSLVVETYTDDTYDGKVYADIPNILLQDTWDIRAYAYCGDKYTKVEERFKVKARTKPADYVYTETEVVNYETLLNKMNSIEDNIGQAVEDYLVENPIEAGATEEEVAQINRNTQDIADIDREIADLPTKEYVDDAVKNVEVDLTDYATKQYVTNQGYLKEVPNEYVTESELTAKGYATETFVNDAIANIDIPEGGSGSNDSFFLDFSNATTDVQDATDTMTAFAEYFVANGGNACAYIRDTGDANYYYPALMSGNGISTIALMKASINLNLVAAGSPITWDVIRLDKYDDGWKYHKVGSNQYTFASKEDCSGTGGSADLSNYYTKTEIDNKGYQTEEQVNALITTALNGIATAEGGSY